MKSIKYVVERCPDTSLYVGYVPGFPVAHGQAESLHGLRSNMKEVVELLLMDKDLTAEELIDAR